jgi:hypothetical protein
MLLLGPLSCVYIKGGLILAAYTLDLESPLGMELILNLAWVLMAASLVCVWLRFALRTQADRRLQFVALAVLLIILLPAISMTDDLQAAQNPAETDICLRRNHECVNPHCIIPVAAALPVPVFAGPSFGILRLAAPGDLSAPVVDHPGLASIQNRPPPAA